GHLPFEGVPAKDLVRAQQSGLQEVPTVTRRDLPKGVDSVFLKAFAFNPIDRFPKARDFGDAFYSALADYVPSPSPEPAAPRPAPRPVAGPPVLRTETLKPLVPVPTASAESETSAVATASAADGEVTATAVGDGVRATASAGPGADAPVWKNRSPEPPQDGTSRSWGWLIAGLLTVVALAGAAWYYIANNPLTLGQGDPAAVATNSVPAGPTVPNTEMPPLPRNLPQPANTTYYENSKEKLRGDLLRNFVGFTIYYPRDWKVNNPQQATSRNARGKFLDISRNTPDGRLMEQMLVSYYPSEGTFKSDQDKFPELVKETNETLKQILPGYQMVSQGETKINGDWRAYEIKFQASGKSASGETLMVWGRRLFVPASRPGARNGFEITMLATSLADAVRSADDVGVTGELATILFSFEPSQNF
ncbi:MAG: hypothetical protein ABR530_03865, partial [Pyrinomonadaceae bacterium]